MTEITKVTIGKKLTGVAGQIGYHATVEYTDADPVTCLFTQVGDTGPVTIDQWFIDRSVTERCGSKLSPNFILIFFGQSA